MANPAVIQQAPDAAPNGASNAPLYTNPFVRAAHESRQPFHDSTHTIGASSIQVGPVDVAAMGYMRNVVIDVVASGGVGSATAAADAPWSALQDISLEDVNGRPILGPVDGYALYLINKWGGYGGGATFDPADLPSYSAVGASGGNFSFKLRIPVEITERDALGALPNLTASATYKLKYSIASDGLIYSAAPATSNPNIRVRAYLEAWSQPRDTDARGMPNEVSPPMMGTTQYWSQSTFNVAAGEQRVQNKRMGNLLRNIILIGRDSSGARADIFPDVMRLEWDNKILDTWSKRLQADQQRERFGINPDTGVWVLDYTHDADGVPGNENRNLYIPTVQGTRFEFIGSFASSGVLTILTNDIAPVGGAPLASGLPGH